MSNILRGRNDTEGDLEPGKGVAGEESGDQLYSSENRKGRFCSAGLEHGEPEED